MNIEIINPDKIIFSGKVDLVQLPGKDGSFEILNKHAPLISVLKEGKIKIIDKNKNTQFFDIKGGVIEVLHNNVLILAE
ncbi:MAG: ATP synthase F1 subunit epsilon [Bacteroidetes bacterium]|nr:ATP synthase F1 subunit epsilon [Bacteroidota bacterium]MBL7105686.1 ATP synthase F1 subunit epsilon [Bacteroidales bacterium]